MWGNSQWLDIDDNVDNLSDGVPARGYNTVAAPLLGYIELNYVTSCGGVNSNGTLETPFSGFIWKFVIFLGFSFSYFVDTASEWTDKTF